MVSNMAAVLKKNKTPDISIVCELAHTVEEGPQSYCVTPEARDMTSSSQCHEEGFEVNPGHVVPVS